MCVTNVAGMWFSLRYFDRAKPISKWGDPMLVVPRGMNTRPG